MTSQEGGTLELHQPRCTVCGRTPSRPRTSAQGSARRGPFARAPTSQSALAPMGSFASSRAARRSSAKCSATAIHAVRPRPCSHRAARPPRCGQAALCVELIRDLALPISSIPPRNRRGSQARAEVIPPSLMRHAPPHLPHQGNAVANAGA